MGKQVISNFYELSLDDFDSSEYGLKTEGLLLLQKSLKNLQDNPENRDDDLEYRLRSDQESLRYCKDYEKEGIQRRIDDVNEYMNAIGIRYAMNFHVDPAFVVPKSISVEDSSRLREKYFELVSKPQKFLGPGTLSTPFDDYSNIRLRIVVARSSDEHELPGKFESSFSLYDPSDPEKSFLGWLAAARIVRESGADAVIGQVLVADAINPKDAQAGRIMDDFASKQLCDDVYFGLESFSLVASTGGWSGPNALMIAAVAGLPTKIVKGTDDCSVIVQPNSDYSPRIIHTQHHYQGGMHYCSSLHGGVPQKTMEILRATNPTTIERIKYNTYSIGSGDESWGNYALPHKFMGLYSFFDLLEFLKKTVGSHVEIEGTFCRDEHFPHIIQLRKYDLPQSRMSELTKVDENRVIYKGEAFVADRFEGDLVILRDIASHERLRQTVSGKYIVVDQDVPDQRNIADCKYLQELPDRSGLIVPFWENKRVMAGAHTFGYMMQLLLELQKFGPVVALRHISHGFSEARDKLQGRFEKQPGFNIVRNVCVESDGESGQIYLLD